MQTLQLIAEQVQPWRSREAVSAFNAACSALAAVVAAADACRAELSRGRAHDWQILRQVCFVACFAARSLKPARIRQLHVPSAVTAVSEVLSS